MTQNFDFNMPVGKVDPNAAQSGEFKPVDKGEYEVFLTELKPGFSSQKGTPQIELVFTIRDDVSGQKFGRRKIFDAIYLTEKAMWRLNSLLVAAGAPGGWEPSVGDAIKFLQSKPLIIGIDHEAYTNNQGEPKVRERVKYFKSSNVGGTAPAAPTANPFGGGGAETPISISDDDLPF